MPHIRRLQIFAGAFSLALTLQTATAQPESGNPRSGPPPEAIAACESMEKGDACTFSGPQGEEVKGSCFAPPHASDKVACAPENMRKPGSAPKN
jgi:hypothetical protein